MFGLGIWELLIILLIVVIIFGAGRLPRAVRELGSSLRELRSGREEDPEKLDTGGASPPPRGDV